MRAPWLLTGALSVGLFVRQIVCTSDSHIGRGGLHSQGGCRCVPLAARARGSSGHPNHALSLQVLDAAETGLEK